MRRHACLLALVAVLAAAASPARAATAVRHPLLADAATFALALGDGQLRPGAARRLGAYDVVVVDGEEVTRAQVRALRRRGAVVLGYLSVGTIERGRTWFPRVRRYRLELWEAWGEWYADVARRGYRDVIAGEVAPALLAKGLDGLFLDNVDMIETHPRRTAGMRALVARLDRLVGPRRVLMAQNGEGVLGPSVRHLDAWNREDVTSTWDGAGYVRVAPTDHRAALAALRRLRAAGLLVTATDYVAADDAAAAEDARAAACAAGALAFGADIGLTRLPPAPPRCTAAVTGTSARDRAYAGGLD